MEGSTLALLGLRIFLLICACVVLGTSADLANYLSALKKDCDALEGKSNCNFEGIVPGTEFGTFVGVWGLIQVIVGTASAFVGAIPWIAVVVVDALAAIFYLAGGVDIAVWLGKPGVCNGDNSKCSEIEADTAFMFLGLITTLVLIGLGFVWQRGGGGKIRSGV